MVVNDEEIERDILEVYRPLSSPDGVENWTTLGAYSVVFRQVLRQREVWVETPVNHFSVTANARKIDKAGNNQSYYLADLDGLRWSFKGRSSAPGVRFGNTTKARSVLSLILRAICVFRGSGVLASGFCGLYGIGVHMAYVLVVSSSSTFSAKSLV